MCIVHSQYWFHEKYCIIERHNMRSDHFFQSKSNMGSFRESSWYNDSNISPSWKSLSYQCYRLDVNQVPISCWLNSSCNCLLQLGLKQLRLFEFNFSYKLQWILRFRINCSTKVQFTLLHNLKMVHLMRRIFEHLSNCARSLSEWKFLPYQLTNIYSRVIGFLFFPSSSFKT